MPRKKRLAAPGGPAELDPFDRQVELALEHLGDDVWLGQQSPLAAPYFIGRAFAPAAGADGRARGQAFARLLAECAATLDGEQQHLLRAAYFARDPYKDNVALAMAMHMSERTFYRMRQSAIKALSRALNQRVAPPLRAESTEARPLVGRQHELTLGVAALEARGSVFLVGPGGVGKSALGAALARQWAAGDGNPAAEVVAAGEAAAYFWYTVRGRFNDQVVSLAFALGYFLNVQGAHNTWRQLVADRGVIDPERIAGLLRFDLAALESKRLLLCIDDLDVLHDDTLEHAQVLHLVEQLRGQCPLLLMGQRVVLDADEVIVLTGLDDASASALLAASGAPDLPESVRKPLLAATRGQPALLHLFAALVRSGDAPDDALFDLMRTPSIEALFNRIWRRLDLPERHLLLQLAVFASPSPLDAWRDEQAALDRLFERQVVENDGAGGVAVANHLRRVLQERITPEQRPLFHLQAASIREARAEITQAMRHALEGGQPARAVWLWFVHRDDEIERGGAAAALELLRRVALATLTIAEDRTALQIARAELYHLVGRMEEAESELQGVTPAGASALAGYVRLMQGKVKDMQGQVEQALQDYRAAIDLLVGLPRQHEVTAHLRLSFLQLYRLHDLEQARRQAMVARAKADAFLGDMETLAGNFAAALEHLQQAAATLDAHGDDLMTRSRVYSYLGRMYGQTGRYDLALEAIDHAIECDTRLGDRVGPLYDLINRATFLKDAGRPAEGEQVARRALAEAQHMQNGYLVAGLAASAAEACLAQQHWGDAEYFALLSLNQEEEFFRAPACAVLASVREAQGKAEEGDRLFAEALDNATQIGDRYTVAGVWRLRGESALRSGRSDEAKSAFDQSRALYAEMGLDHHVQQLAQREG